MLSNLTIKLSNRCDCRCSYCYYKDNIYEVGSRNGDIGTHTFLKAIQQYYDYVATRYKGDLYLRLGTYLCILILVIIIFFFIGVGMQMGTIT